MAAPVIPAFGSIRSRASGTAPLAVFFDASGTTDADTSTPFHDLLYLWDFGDPNAGTWTYGANAGQSKNFAIGPVAAHVYETAGTFTVTLRVKDGTNTSVRTGTITVTAADTTFSGTNTICVSTSGNFTGAPAGCTQVTSSDFDAPGGTNLYTSLTAGKRVLFRGGETFIASANTDIDSGAGPCQVGSFGTGRAKVQWTGAAAGTGFLRVSGTAADVRITDLELDGQSVSTQGSITFGASAWANALLLNNYIHDIGYALAPDWNATGGSGLFVVGNRIETILNASTDGILASNGSTVAVMGNNIDMAGGGQQGIRYGNIIKSVIASNTVSGVIATKSSIDLRGGSTGSQYSVISDNKVVMTTAYVGINPGNGPSASYPVTLTDSIIERNYITGTHAGQTVAGMDLSAERCSVRNNIIDATMVGMTIGISVTGTLGAVRLPAKDNWVYNNTIYSAKSSGSLTAVIVDTDASTGNVIKNTLVYSSGITATAVSDTGAVATKSNNTAEGTGAGSVKTNPFVTTPTSTLTTYEASSGAYAYNGGTVLYPATASDFFGGWDKTAAQYRRGAVVTRSLAICTGVP